MKIFIHQLIHDHVRLLKIFNYKLTKIIKQLFYSKYIIILHVFFLEVGLDILIFYDKEGQRAFEIQHYFPVGPRK